MLSVVSVEGGRELRKQMRQAGIDLNNMREAHRQIGAIAAPAARAACPVRTGTLAKTVRSTGTLTATVIRAGFKSVPYANPIHWGWFRRNIKPSLFASHAAQRTEPAWRDAYFNKCLEILNQIKGIK